jgi:hypothetical protein
MVKAIRQVKLIRAQGECLGTRSRRRTWQAAKSCGEAQTAIDPQMSEWGNPPEVNAQVSVHEHIVYGGETQGTETSKYLQEKKSTEIP